MRLILATLVLTGIGILVGFAYVGVEIYNRFNNAEPPATLTSLPAAPTTDTALGLGSDARVRSIHPLGDRRVLVIVGAEGMGDRLLVLDPIRGTVIGRVDTESAPSALPEPQDSAEPPITDNSAADAAAPGSASTRADSP